VSMQRFKRLLMDFCQRQLKLTGTAEGHDTGGSFVSGLRLRLARTDLDERLMDQTLIYDGFDDSDELLKKYREKRRTHTTADSETENVCVSPPLYKDGLPEKPATPSEPSWARVSSTETPSESIRSRVPSGTNGTDPHPTAGDGPTGYIPHPSAEENARETPSPS
jgi:hypothetical protein